MFGRPSFSAPWTTRRNTRLAATWCSTSWKYTGNFGPFLQEHANESVSDILRPDIHWPYKAQLRWGCRRVQTWQPAS